MLFPAKSSKAMFCCVFLTSCPLPRYFKVTLDKTQLASTTVCSFYLTWCTITFHSLSNIYLLSFYYAASTVFWVFPVVQWLYTQHKQPISIYSLTCSSFQRHILIATKSMIFWLIGIQTKLGFARHGSAFWESAPNMGHRSLTSGIWADFRWYMGGQTLPDFKQGGCYFFYNSLSTFLIAQERHSSGLE